MEIYGGSRWNEFLKEDTMPGKKHRNTFAV
jgi:hypothetical protein